LELSNDDFKSGTIRGENMPVKGPIDFHPLTMKTEKGNIMRDLRELSVSFTKWNGLPLQLGFICDKDGTVLSKVAFGRPSVSRSGAPFSILYKTSETGDLFLVCPALVPKVGKFMDTTTIAMHEMENSAADLEQDLKACKLPHEGDKIAINLL
jgi:hypothetical protein